MAAAPTVLLLLAAAVSVEIQAASPQPACPAAPGGGTKTAAQRLHHALFCAYDRSVLPLADVTKSLEVTVTVWMHSITVNEYSHETLEVNTWILLTWNDDYLAWDPKVYEGITDLRAPADRIWTPTFVMSEPRHGPWITMHRPSEVCALTSSGSVECMWPATFSMPCQISYRNWPFDTQTCEFALLAIEDNTTRLHMVLDNETMNSWMLPNPEWDLVSTQSQVEQMSGLMGPFGSRTPVLTFKLELRRRPAVYVAAVTVPAIGVMLMTLLPYLLQPTLAQRSLLAAMGILAHLFGLQLLSSMLYGPSGIIVPPIVLLYRDSLVLCSLSLLVSVGHRWLLAASPDPPLALKDASSRLLDFWARNLSFVRLQHTQEPAPRPVTPAADFWQRWVNAADGCGLAVSLLAYVILLIRFLP